MNNHLKPDEAMLIAYCYGEIDDADRSMVEAYLAEHPEELRRLESWGFVRKAMSRLEDEEVIAPIIREFAAKGYDISGPVPGDTVFIKLRAQQFDAVVAMFHDQGHIPVKLLGFNVDEKTGVWHAISGVNVTLGLPILRTSVDHGTAFDIAGKGIANADSLVDAVEYAVKLLEGQRKKREAQSS